MNVFLHNTHYLQPDPPPHKVLYLRYLPPDLMASELRSEFSQFGPLDHLDHLPKRNMAFVEFVNLDGKELKLKEGKKKKKENVILNKI